MYSHEKNIHLSQYLKFKAYAEKSKNETFFIFEPKSIEIFNVTKMQAILKEHETKSNLHRNHKRFITYLGETAGYLPSAILPHDIFQKLDKLCINFPNFSPAVDFYRKQFALSRLVDPGVFSANPLLLAGPPGIGKTAFCHAIAAMVSTHFELISLSGMTAGFVLGGMASSWADGKPGRVVEALAKGRLANPLIVVDEMDKAGGDKRYDPIGPLYQLLEKETSTIFVDEALEIATNCSHIVWVGTANQLHEIAEPILSRFTILQIKPPNEQQMEKVLRSIFHKIMINHEWGERFNKQLSASVISKLIDNKLEPRQAQKVLIDACGKSALRQSGESMIRNAGYEISPDDLNLPAINKRKVSVIMPFFRTASVNEEPEEFIVEWSIREVSIADLPDKTHHLVGYIMRQRLGRVSSVIQSFDRDHMRIITRSGRIYHLQGQPGFNPDAEYVWEHWKAINDIKDEVNVTNEYYQVH